MPDLTPFSTGVSVSCARVINFRCLKQVEVYLTPLTVLVGENNAGKTSFLDALYAAVGAGTRHLSEEDIYISCDEAKPPKERAITVDLLIHPTGVDGDRIDAFPQGSAWLQLWGNGVSQDDDDNDFVALRMTMSWDTIKGDYYVQRRFLRKWPENINDISTTEVAERVSQVRADQIAPLALYLLDAKRDAVDEMRQRGSVWNRLVSDHGLADEDVAQIESQLSEINSFLVGKSGVLSHLQEHLNTVSTVISCDDKNTSVNPVARRLRDLSKGIDVVLSTRGAPQFPLARQGMGTRSLTSVLLFRAYMTWRQKLQSLEALHPFVAVEEPESHLHPQAQRALFHQLHDLPGQKIISTHSPYICSQANVGEFVHFFKESDSTATSRFYDRGEQHLDSESIRKINRQVMNTRGDLLFSRCVVLFEGETEEQALPGFASHHWGKHPHSLGVSFISVSGSGNYLPFLRLATRFQIPWIIVSDGENKAIVDLDNALQKADEEPSANHSRCFVLPNGSCFEEYVVTPTSLAEMRQMIADYKIETSGVTDLREQDGLVKKWNAKSHQDIVKELTSHKTTYGARIAAAFGHLAAEDRVPQLLRDAFDEALPPGLNT